jgi:hypothetical protein
VPALAVLLGGIVLAVRLWDAGLAITEGLQAAGLMRIAIGGFVQLLLPALISMGLSLLVALVLLPKVTVASGEAERSGPIRRPSLILTSLVVLVCTTTLTLAVLGVTGQTFAADGLNAAYVTVTDRTTAFDELARRQEPIQPGDVTERVCLRRSASNRLYRCAGRLIATDTGSVTLGVQDALVRIPASEILYYNVLPGETLHGWSDETAEQAPTHRG